MNKDITGGNGKDESIFTVITKGFVQEFLEENLGRKFKKLELEELESEMWMGSYHLLLDWIHNAAEVVVKKAN